MNVNDMIDTILNFDLDVVLAGLNESSHHLSQMEFISLIVITAGAVAVYDKANDKNLAQIWNTADIYLPEFDDFNVFWNRVSEEEKEQLLIVE